MAQSERDHQIAIAVTDKVIGAAGDEHYHFVTATEPDVETSEVQEVLEQVLPPGRIGEIVDGHCDDCSRRTSLGSFSFSNWNSPWNPKGPTRKTNGGWKPPENPQLN